MNKNESKYFNTASLMDEALLALLQKKEYEFITIKEVCQKAGVNRSTFYLHYESMDDLLKESIGMIHKRFYDAFGKRPFPDVAKLDKKQCVFVTAEYLTPYLTFIKDNKKIFRLMCDKSALFEAQKTFDSMYKRLFQPVLDKFDVPKSEQEYQFAYYFGGIMQIVMKWLENECTKPVDEVVKIIEKCIFANLAEI